MRKLRLTLVAAAAVAILSATAAGPATGSSRPEGPSAEPAVAHSSGKPGSKRKKAKRKALRNCNRKASSTKRRSCRKRVRKRFEKKPIQEKPSKPVRPAATIEVADDFFFPNNVNVESGESILWKWNDMNHDPHNLTLTSAPAGVDRSKLETAASPAVDYSFSRTFTIPGTYEFACSLHFNMKLTVVVS